MWQMVKSVLGPTKMKAGHHDWTFRLFVMAVLCLTLSADNGCEIEIKVRRHTVYEASLGQQLKIACPVSVCDNLPPTITWFKLETDSTKQNLSGCMKTEWTSTNNNEGTYFLIFNNIVSSDSGQYQCHSPYAVSHRINVTVTDTEVNKTETLQDQTNTTSPVHDNNKQLWLYLYTAAGIVGFVIIVIVISVLSMRGCKGEQKKNRRENQYMDIPMIEQPVHHPSNQALPRASPCGTPSHRTSRKKKCPSAPNQRDNVYDQIEGTRNVPEEAGSSVVYAALNHQHLTGASPRSRAVVDERSEYAAIRVS